MKKFIMFFIAIVIIILGCIILKNKYENKNNSLYFVRAGSIDIDDLSYKDVLITEYEKYQEVMLRYQMEEAISKEEFEKYNFLVLIIENDYCSGIVSDIMDNGYKDNIINLSVNIDSNCDMCATKNEMYLVRFNKNYIKDNYKVNMDYSDINCVKE